MTAPPTTMPVPVLEALAAAARDAHRRQRDLVRASLVLCPGKAEPRS
ncbi:MAG: hypothetical protein ACAH82_06875 [Solirubrobacteraceae bacterium]